MKELGVDGSLRAWKEDKKKTIRNNICLIF